MFLDKKKQAENFQLVRIYLGFEKPAMAKEMELSREYITQIENCKRDLSFSVLEKLYSIFYKIKNESLSLNWLLLGIGDMVIQSSDKESETKTKKIILESELKNIINNILNK